MWRVTTRTTLPKRTVAKPNVGSIHSIGDFSVLAEPQLALAFGQSMADPKSGLSLFGPYDLDQASQPKQISYAVVAPEGSVETCVRFFDRLREPVVSEKYSAADADRTAKLLWPPWPGFEAAFHSNWPGSAAGARGIDRNALLKSARNKDRYQRAYDVAGYYLKAIRSLVERDEHYGVILCVIPDEIWLNCRPQSRVTDGHGIDVSRAERKRRRRQADLFSPYLPEQYDYSVDARRQLKARAMEHRVPLQLVRESTLLTRDSLWSDARTLTPLSDRAWNLTTTLYYKAGGKPWKLSTARPGVCYVGLAFRRSELDDEPSTACCAAQMFLDSGDGVVFRGEFGPWYSPDNNSYHLDEPSAEELLRGVLQAYTDQGGTDLREIFLHSRSTISLEEFRGYARACPPGVRLVGVRIRRDGRGPRVYRAGDWAVLRGTLWRLSERSAYLFASGFKPTLLSYDGWEVPIPLRIDIEHGDADITQIATDVLGLTKLNYNACKLGDASPVTIGFSDMVGEILIGNPTVSYRSPSFRFYI